MNQPPPKTTWESRPRLGKRFEKQADKFVPAYEFFTEEDKKILAAAGWASNIVVSPCK